MLFPPLLVLSPTNIPELYKRVGDNTNTGGMCGNADSVFKISAR